MCDKAQRVARPAQTRL